MTSRREFITLLGGAAAWLVAARAQQREKMRRVGVLMPLPADDPVVHARVAAFAQGLQQSGWTIGRNVQIDTRWAAADAERIRSHAAELVALAPNVILTSGNAGVAPLLQASRTVPIVFAIVMAGACAEAAMTCAPAALAAWEPSQRYPDPAVQSLDPSFNKYRLALAGVERLASGCRFNEGAVYFGDARCLLWSDIPNNRIMRWDEETGRISIFRQPSNHANGNTRDRQGRLITCEHSGRRITRTEYDGVTVLIDRFDGKPLNGTNDVVVSGLATVVTTGLVKRPNGLAFSPDESKLYVIESAPEGRSIYVFDVVDGGVKLANGRLFINCEKEETPDGFRVDVDGNLWCGWGMSPALDGVKVFNPAGKAIGFIALPERAANVCFGGRYRNRLFMAASHSIYSLYVNTQGVAGG